MKATADDEAANGVFFQFEDSAYAFNDINGTAPGEYDNADFAIQIMGTHDLSADNADNADNAAIA